LYLGSQHILQTSSFIEMRRLGHGINFVLIIQWKTQGTQGVADVAVDTWEI